MVCHWTLSARHWRSSKTQQRSSKRTMRGIFIWCNGASGICVHAHLHKHVRKHTCETMCVHVHAYACVHMHVHLCMCAHSIVGYTHTPNKRFTQGPSPQDRLKGRFGGKSANANPYKIATTLFTEDIPFAISHGYKKVCALCVSNTMSCCPTKGQEVKVCMSVCVCVCVCVFVCV